MTVVIGIDPGLAGGIAWTEGPDKLGAVKMPETERDVADVIERLANLPELTVAYIERVHSSPQMGVTSAFTFGRGYGFLRGLLTARCIPFDEVTPRTWQKEFSLLRRSSSESGTDKKNRHKAKAQQLWPDLKVTHATADALLICEWARRRREGGAG
ncbi:MAG: hypothetical protein GY701_28900 [Sulfitobacter sp.]|nr:hypothetical protein [Sulfitobacter sp.]